MPASRIFFYRSEYAPQLIGMMLLFAVVSHSIPLEAQEKRSRQTSCLNKLQNPSLQNINCTLDFYLDKQTQKSMQSSTAGMIRNAACKIKISITKKMIFTALLNEKVLQVPKQPAGCNIHALGDSLPTKFFMAPKVKFAGGKAVEARPGISDVSGLPDILAKLLTNWVNSSKTIENALLEEINYSLKSIRLNPRKNKGNPGIKPKLQPRRPRKSNE